MTTLSAFTRAHCPRCGEVSQFIGNACQHHPNVTYAAPVRVVPIMGYNNQLPEFAAARQKRAARREKVRAVVAPGDLTARETQVLGYYARGMSRASIAIAMDLLPTAVTNYLGSIYEKLAVPRQLFCRDHSALIAEGRGRGLIA